MSDTRTPRHDSGPRSSRAFSLAEAVVSSLIIGLMLVAALTTVGASKAGQFQVDLATRGEFLAEELLAEIMAQDFSDAGASTGDLGEEAGDGSIGRTGFDDVDDYNDWNASPPTDRKGVAIDGFDGWTRAVEVTNVLANDLSSTSGSETGVKRIKVTVAYANKTVATLESIRTDAWTYYNAGKAQPVRIVDRDDLPLVLDPIVVLGGGN